jgi:hypothetical protein
MKPLIRQIARLLGAAFIVVVIGALPVAKAAVPTNIAERLRQTAGLWQTSIEQQKQMRQFNGNTPSTAMAGDMNRRVYSSMMAQAVMEAITRNPADTLDVTNAAIDAVPDLKAGILQHLSIAFPTMGSTFAGATQAVSPIQVVTATAGRAPPLSVNEAKPTWSQPKS